MSQLTRTRLDVAANIAVILTCVFAAATLARLWFVGGVRPQARARPSVAVGDVLGEVPEIGLPSQPRRLVLALSRDCRFCRESLPLFSRLASSSKGVEVLVVTNDPQDSTTEYLAAAQVRADRIVSPIPSRLEIRAVPTVLVLGARNRVLAVSTGQPDERTERNLEEALAPRAARADSPAM